MQQNTVFVENSKPTVSSRDLLCALGGSFFIALCAQVSITLPFTLVPTSLQPQAVLLTAAVLGGKRGFLAILAYLLEGAFGLPVFAQGHAGVFYLVGATGGYLLSYLPVSLLVGWLCQSIAKHQITKGAAMFLGNIVIICCGTAWLSCVVGPSLAWSMGAAPFIITDALKIIMATILLPGVHYLLRGFCDEA